MAFSIVGGGGLYRIRILSLSNSCAAEGECAGQGSSGQGLWQTLHAFLLLREFGYLPKVLVLLDKIIITTVFTAVTLKILMNIS